jgi:acyl-coenzyme A thioesterase PaaI-like protein
MGSSNLPNNDLPSDVLQNDGFCFGCGPLNPIGLRLTFEWDNDTYQTFWTPGREHQGWANRVHGGLLALVLDEALSRAALDRHGLHWVTAELTTRLKAPASVGETLHITAQIETVRPRLIVCAGEVRTKADNRLIATGSAKMMRAA